MKRGTLTSVKDNPLHTSPITGYRMTGILRSVKAETGNGTRPVREYITYSCMFFTTKEDNSLFCSGGMFG